MDPVTTTVREAYAWYTPEEAAAMTKRGVAQVRAAIRSGELKAKQPGARNYKVRADWLDAWMDSQPDA